MQDKGVLPMRDGLFVNLLVNSGSSEDPCVLAAGLLQTPATENATHLASSACNLMYEVHDVHKSDVNLRDKNNTDLVNDALGDTMDLFPNPYANPFLKYY